MPVDIGTFLIVLGRLVFGGIFVVDGLLNFRNFAVLEAIMSKTGLPAPRLVLIAGLLLMTGSGALVMSGYALSLGGLGLALFILVATALFHRFWDFGGQERKDHFNAFLSNCALFGGALVLAGLGAQ